MVLAAAITLASKRTANLTKPKVLPRVPESDEARRMCMLVTQRKNETKPEIRLREEKPISRRTDIQISSGTMVAQHTNMKCNDMRIP
ncbi:uncharacterized protein BDR25DRAFT_54447 [Lindgomyces ingoldianus]|uniref:Uncharacterized protein n=1 Tax=Lindgomyces ingoldianus TaxID=673940 RepID=A0ACB6QS86_9PLEO|nr:uncharacterized protein BDR25DRAFT_54447 [Lindgomyces ingoldianus]KAF2468965.1 hypothetical protein BDR25DRAFT_54447 [Lindgomyces ingoldianus]